MMHYSDTELLMLLDSTTDDDTTGDDASLSHLETCDSCRERLSRLCSEGDWLDELSDSVRDENRVTCQMEMSGASSVLVTLDGSSSHEPGIGCDSIPLDFLESPRHPELLGRLGRYDIERMIGVGGFGIVFKAYDTDLNRVVAIKALAPHLLASGPARKRFAREAQASAAIVHDHVVAIYDVVSEPTPYFVMQYVPGKSLQERVDRFGPLAIDETLRIASQIALGLSAAHEQGLIHRDVKPANIMLEESSVERVLVSDFGLARTADDASLTRSGTITGTPHYMSPEQARGAAIDTRSDIFSLGSVIYFMCTGHSPFRAPNMMAVLNRICNVSHRPLEEANQSVPMELAKLVNQMLGKSADQRPATVEQVSWDLNRMLSDLQAGRLRPRRLGPEPASPNWLMIAAGIIVVCLLAFRLFLGDPGEPQTPSLKQSTTSFPSDQRKLSAQTPSSQPTPEHSKASWPLEHVVAEWRHEPFSAAAKDPWDAELKGIQNAVSNLEDELQPGKTD